MLVLAISYVLALFLLAAAFLFLADRVRDRRNRVSPEELARQRAEYDERLRNPKWDELEGHFGRPAAPELKELYSSALVLREDVSFLLPSVDDPENEEYVTGFSPADLRAVRDALWVVADGSFPFAGDGMGNYYTVDFTRGGPVRIHMHDGGQAWDVAPTLGEFVGAMREGKRAGAAQQAHAAGEVRDG
jgi:hypothetical protein